MSSYAAMPRVSIILVTYRRWVALEQTVRSLREHIDIDDYELIICDDGDSRGADRRRIEQLEPDLFLRHDRWGYGRNANAGLRAARGEFVLHMEDDQVVWSGGHFLEAGMRVLRALPELGVIQYFGENELCRYRARRQVEELSVEILPLAPTGAQRDDIFRYKNRPHLKHVSFHAAYGMYPEGYCPFETEYLFAQRVNEIRGPRIAWIRDAVVFLDIGKQYGSNAWLPPKSKEPV